MEWYDSFAAFTGHKGSTKLTLDGVEYIGTVDMDSEYKYAFFLFGEGQCKLQMAAKNETDRVEWMKTLKNCIALNNGQKSNPTSPNLPRENAKTGTSGILIHFLSVAMTWRVFHRGQASWVCVL